MWSLRIALLQRKTLIETKNHKWHYSTVRSINNVAALTEEGAFALFFGPHPWGFDGSRVPTRGNLPSKAKKMLMPEGQPGGGRGWAGRSWNWLMLRKTLLFSRSDKRQDFAWNRQQTEWNVVHKLSPCYLQKPAYGSMPLEPAETRPISNFPESRVAFQCTTS